MQRWSRFTQYVQQAHHHQLSPADLEVHTKQLLRSLPGILRIPWDNNYKELFWRLLVNGVPAAGGGDICHLNQPCPCSFRVDQDMASTLGSMVHRQHVFWDCPVAEAVREEMLRSIPGVTLSQVHVWCLISPSPLVMTDVWIVVCLAALHAMEQGRRCLWRCSADGLGDSMTEAKTTAVTHFWAVLHDFCQHAHIASWQGRRFLSFNHPFLALVLQHPPLVPRVSVNRPD